MPDHVVPIADTPYLQPINERHLPDEGLRGDSVRAACSDGEGTVWFATEWGLNRTDGHSWFRQAPRMDRPAEWITALKSDSDGYLWAGTSDGLMRFNGNLWETVADVPGQILSIAFGDDDQVWLASSEGLFKVTPVIVDRVDALGEEHCQVVLVHDGTVWVGQQNSLIRLRGKQVAKYTGDDGIPAGEIRAICPDPDGNILVGTRSGLVVQSDDGWKPVEGIPYAAVTDIAVGGSGQLWVGTDRGVCRRDASGEWRYFQGPRWFPSESVTHVIPDGPNDLWCGTMFGVGRIRFEEVTLSEKAEHVERISRARHNRYGWVTGASMRRAGQLETSQPRESDNDGLWTCLYLAAESFRYAATNEPIAQRYARQAFAAVADLMTKTDIPGFATKAARERGRTEPHAGEPRWNPSPDPRWEWKDDHSSDETMGHFFGYSIFYDLAATDEDKAQVSRVASAILDHILDNDLTIIKRDGLPTRWGRWEPAALNDDPDWIEDRGLNSLAILGHLRAGYHFSGNERYMEKYRDLVENHHYAENTLENKIIDPPSHMNHSDDELATCAFYPLLKYEDDPKLREIYLEAFRLQFEPERIENCPWWNFQYTAFVPDDGDHPGAVFTLREYPWDLVHWPVDNRHRLDIEMETYPSRFGREQLHTLLPISERPMKKWNSSPFDTHGGSPSGEEDGGAFLLPYWMGRYYGFIVDE